MLQILKYSPAVGIPRRPFALGPSARLSGNSSASYIRRPVVRKGQRKCAANSDRAVAERGRPRSLGPARRSRFPSCKGAARNRTRRHIGNGRHGLNNIKGQRRLATQTFVRSPRRLWLGADHPFLAKPAVSLREIAAEPYIMLTVDEAELTTMRYWRRSHLAPRVAFCTSSLESVRGMVVAGLGLTILADIVYRPWSLEGSRIEDATLLNQSLRWMSA
jgi:LysR substrate binding domain